MCTSIAYFYYCTVVTWLQKCPAFLRLQSGRSAFVSCYLIVIIGRYYVMTYDTWQNRASGVVVSCFGMGYYYLMSLSSCDPARRQWFVNRLHWFLCTLLLNYMGFCAVDVPRGWQNRSKIWDMFYKRNLSTSNNAHFAIPLRLGCKHPMESFRWNLTDGI